MANRWIQAARLRTLPLTLSSIVLGTALAAEVSFFNPWVFVGCLLTALLFQVLSNFANDYGDGVKGTDANRTGEKRAVASGSISATEMKKAVYLFSVLSLASALALVFYATRQLNPWITLTFVVVGLAAIWAAITYTVGKNAYGYKGLGDIYVFVFFGLVGVGGSYYLQTSSLDALMFLPAASVGLLSVGVLNLNNMRDLDTDKEAGKITIALRLGLPGAKVYHTVLVLLAWDLAFLYSHFMGAKPFGWLYWLSLPLFIIHLRQVFKSTSAQLDPKLKQLALGTLLFVVLLSLSRVL